MYIDLNERKHLFAERFIRILKNKIYKCVSVSKNLYIDKLDDKYTKYYNTYLIGVNSSTYINSGKENNEKDPKFEVGGHVHISKKNFFWQKVTLRIGLKKILLLKKLKILCLTVKKLWERVKRKKLQETNQTEFRIERIIQRKGDKLYVKWKRYDNSFDS